MTVTIRIVDYDVSIDKMKLTCDDKVVEDALRSLLPANGHSGADPDPDYTMAKKIVDMFNGQVISRDTHKQPPKGAII